MEFSEKAEEEQVGVQSPSETGASSKQSVSGQLLSTKMRPPNNTEQIGNRIAYLESAIETATNERNELREQLRHSARNFELIESLILSKTELKEKELRHFLAPRLPNAESDHMTSQLPITTVPIQSTVPAVRPVPTLIGGSTKVVDGLLGPAHPTSGTSTSMSSGSLTGSHQSSAGQGGSKANSQMTNGRRSTPRNNHTDSTSLNEDDDLVIYTEVPVDHSVGLVLSRLRRTQNSCNALVTSNQADLQSFTFTQNSQNGKRIMMRFRILEQENEELAKGNRVGRTARLETEIALRRRFVHDLKQSHSDMEYLVEEVEAETEVFGNSLLLLQQRLNLAKTTAHILASALESTKPGSSGKFFEDAAWLLNTENPPGPLELPPLADLSELDISASPDQPEHDLSTNTVVSDSEEIPDQIQKSVHSTERLLKTEPGCAKLDSRTKKSLTSGRLKQPLKKIKMALSPRTHDARSSEEAAKNASEISPEISAVPHKRPRTDVRISPSIHSLVHSLSSPPKQSKKVRPTIPIDSLQRTFSRVSQNPVEESLERTPPSGPTSFDASGSVDCFELNVGGHTKSAVSRSITLPPPSHPFSANQTKQSFIEGPKSTNVGSPNPRLDDGVRVSE
ncbi:unnamed protein product [Calicophoron daubneyi]|uniref:Uncharacterized protein n=1 Tax=Calicophoron daubneyi TaxID=300641 RepID=A0AAV2TTV7_CALDB